MATHHLSHFKENLIDEAAYINEAAEASGRSQRHSAHIKNVSGAPMTLTRSSSTLSQSSPFIAKKQYTIVYVIKKGYFNLVRHLLDLGVDPNFVSDKDDPKLLRCPLIYATFIRDDKWAYTVAQNLLEYGASLQRADLNHLTPIHYACAFGRPHLLELFLSSLDFDLSRVVDANGNSCIHYAMRSHNLKCLQLLIKKYNSYYMQHVHVVLSSPYHEQAESLNDKLNCRNKLGLRPSDLGEEVNDNEQHNFVYSGKDSLHACRSALVDFLSIESVAKLKRETAALAAVAAAAQAAAIAADTEIRNNLKNNSTTNDDSNSSHHSTAAAAAQEKASLKKGGKKSTKSVAKKPDNEQINELDENELVSSRATKAAVGSQKVPPIVHHQSTTVPVPIEQPPQTVPPHILEPNLHTAHFGSVYEVSQEIKVSPMTKVLLLNKLCLL
jgi:hypothetical protein